ncbi:MAG: methyltransferase domain-containing protein [Bacteroidales bacterium]|nr:methyltransferase domain-containing protein [Bacteroidales bacterium]
MNLKLLNLGCGSHYHEEWTNVDFVGRGKSVRGYNLTNGIPFPDNSFDVVYNSHVLEHFSRREAICLINEIKRVLKPKGILRIAIPDLRVICQLYNEIVNDLLEGSNNRENDYDWIMLELFDQTVRKYGGGEMGEYLTNKNIINKDFIISRIGFEAKNIWNKVEKTEKKIFYFHIKRLAVKIINKIKVIFLKIILGKKNYSFMEEGRYRNSGEIHKWMYDEYSLTRLLRNNGFIEIKKMSAFESQIPDFGKYELDVVKNEIRKPDSLFVECIKPA